MHHENHEKYESCAILRVLCPGIIKPLLKVASLNCSNSVWQEFLFESD